MTSDNTAITIASTPENSGTRELETASRNTELLNKNEIKSQALSLLEKGFSNQGSKSALYFAAAAVFLQNSAHKSGLSEGNIRTIGQESVLEIFKNHVYKIIDEPLGLSSHRFSTFHNMDNVLSQLTLERTSTGEFNVEYTTSILKPEELSLYYSKFINYVLQSNADGLQKHFYIKALQELSFAQRLKELSPDLVLFPDLETKLEEEFSQIRVDLFHQLNLDPASIARDLSIAHKDIGSIERLANDFALGLCKNGDSETASMFAFHMASNLYKNNEKSRNEYLGGIAKTSIKQGKGEKCLEVYDEYKEHMSSLQSFHNTPLQFNAYYVHKHYTDKEDIDALRTKLSTSTCSSIHDHKLPILLFKTSDPYEIFEFDIYKDQSTCLSKFVGQLIFEGNEEFLDKIQAYLSKKEDNSFKNSLSGSDFWTDLLKQLHSEYTFANHIKFCSFVSKIPEDFMTDVKEELPGEDKYGYMRLCELRDYENDPISIAKIQLRIGDYNMPNQINIITTLLEDGVIFLKENSADLFKALQDVLNKGREKLESHLGSITQVVEEELVRQNVLNNPQKILELLLSKESELLKKALPDTAKANLVLPGTNDKVLKIQLSNGEIAHVVMSHGDPDLSAQHAQSEEDKKAREEAEKRAEEAEKARKKAELLTKTLQEKFKISEQNKQAFDNASKELKDFLSNQDSSVKETLCSYHQLYFGVFVGSALLETLAASVAIKTHGLTPTAWNSFSSLTLNKILMPVAFLSGAPLIVCNKQQKYTLTINEDKKGFTFPYFPENTLADIESKVCETLCLTNDNPDETCQIKQECSLKYSMSEETKLLDYLEL